MKEETKIEKKPIYKIGDVCCTERGKCEVILEIKEGRYYTMHLNNERILSLGASFVEIRMGDKNNQDFENFEIWRYKKIIGTNF